jgi:hypothetical protein
VPAHARGSDSLPLLSWRGDAKIPTDLPDEWVGDFRVPGHCRPSIVCGIAPPRVTPPFADQDASVFPKVLDHLVAFHASMLTSS